MSFEECQRRSQAQTWNVLAACFLTISTTRCHAKKIAPWNVSILAALAALISSLGGGGWCLTVFKQFNSNTGLYHFRLRLETLQTFDQSDVQMKRQKGELHSALTSIGSTWNDWIFKCVQCVQIAWKSLEKSTAVLCDIFVTSRNTPSDLNYECCCIYAASSQGFLLQRLETSFLFWTRWWLQCLQAQKRLQKISSVS